MAECAMSAEDLGLTESDVLEFLRIAPDDPKVNMAYLRLLIESAIWYVVHRAGARCIAYFKQCGFPPTVKLFILQYIERYASMQGGKPTGTITSEHIGSLTQTFGATGSGADSMDVDDLWSELIAPFCDDNAKNKKIKFYEAVKPYRTTLLDRWT